MNLCPENGVLRLLAPMGMTLSDSPDGTPKEVLEMTYQQGRLWNKCFYLHFAPLKEELLDTAIQITYGNQTRKLPVKAVCKEISQKEDVVREYSNVTIKGLKATEKGLSIESGIWPAEIDEDGNRYVELIVRNNEKNFIVQQVSFTLVGKVNYRIAYAHGKDFYPRTDIGENQQGERVEFPINTTLKPGEQLHIRFFPWSTSTGQMNFELKNWLVRGIEIE